METNLTKEYLDRITRSCGGTVAKPATVNVRSDAASANEAATAVAGAGPGVPEWKLMCVVMEGENTGLARWCSVLSPTRKYWWSEIALQWFPTDPSKGLHGQVYIGAARASAVLAAIVTCPPDWPTPAHADDPREEPEPFCEATGPMVESIGTTHRLDPSPCGTFVRKITKPCESIEKLIDRLAKVNGAIEVSHGMTYRVTGNIEKAEPRSWDTPGYPAHFSLHHVYMPEDWTRGVLMSIAYGLDGKLDKGTIRTVLEQVSRSLVLTGELDEADLIGLAVAVEDKLDIGK